MAAEIAAAADVSRATFFFHFPAKAALLRELSREIAELWAQEPAPPDERGPTSCCASHLPVPRDEQRRGRLGIAGFRRDLRCRHESRQRPRLYPRACARHQRSDAGRRCLDQRLVSRRARALRHHHLQPDARRTRRSLNKSLHVLGRRCLAVAAFLISTLRLMEIQRSSRPAEGRTSQIGPGTGLHGRRLWLTHFRTDPENGAGRQKR